MEDEKPKSRIDLIIDFNNTLITKITANMDENKQDQSDDVVLLILEKQISIINFLKKQISYYQKVGLKIEKDKKAGKKTTLKKMKSVNIDESKNTEKEDSDDKPKKKSILKKDPPKKKDTKKKSITSYE